MLVWNRYWFWTRDTGDYELLHHTVRGILFQAMKYPDTVYVVRLPVSTQRWAISDTEIKTRRLTTWMHRGYVYHAGFS